MSLNGQLSSLYEQFQNGGPPKITSLLKSTKANFAASFQPGIKVGDILPEFHLKDALGIVVNSADLLVKGPLLLTFYRGEWCPYCNLALAAMQKHNDQFKAKGVTLVAITPELPNQSLTTTEKHDLKFPVLSDVGNRFAR